MRGEGKNGDFFIVSAFVCFVVIFYVCKYATAVVTASRTGYQMALRVEPVSENAQAFRALTPFRCQSFVRKDDTYPLLLLPLSLSPSVRWARLCIFRGRLGATAARW